MSSHISPTIELSSTQPQLSLRITNPSPPSPSPPQDATPATTRTTSTRVRFLLPAEIPYPDKTINLHLLRSECYLSFGTPNLALQQADIALHIATERNLYKLEAKSQFYRGKCLMEAERWKEAKWALVRAASLRDHKGEVAKMGRECEEQVEVEKWIVEVEKFYKKQIEDMEREKRG
ncbi:hypothetical protein EG329_007699 [Mollisiaceae sp. DMI_Dod_QoI]|nr:hypothetical protein EG329_007699 [Helotiales sp. DMI_Dod_QoI]